VCLFEWIRRIRPLEGKVRRLPYWSKTCKSRAAESLTKVMIQKHWIIPFNKAILNQQYQHKSMENNSTQTESVEHPLINIDIACVGFGPAMGGFLTTLSASY
jgi:hypothetical protein